MHPLIPFSCLQHSMYSIKLPFKCSFTIQTSVIGLSLKIFFRVLVLRSSYLRNYLLMLIDVFLFFLCLFATYRSGGAKGPGIFFIIPCTDSYQKVRAVISTIILLVLVMIIITDSNTNAMNRLYFSKSICLLNCSKHKPCIFFSVVQ